MPKTPKPKTIADQLRAAINDSGVTVYRVAKDSGVTPGVVARFLSGERDLRLETAAKICQALGLELKRKG